MTSKEDLNIVLELNSKIIDKISEKDSMRITYISLNKFLEERIATYEKFVNNPYSAKARVSKLNSDTVLDLGEYYGYNI